MINVKCIARRDSFAAKRLYQRLLLNVCEHGGVKNEKKTFGIRLQKDSIGK